MLGGQPRDNIGRLNNTTPATQALGYDGWSITWLRGGSSPEVYQTAFDFSANGLDWASLGYFGTAARPLCIIYGSVKGCGIRC